MKTDPGAQVEIQADGQRLDVSGEEVQQGQRYKFSIPEDAASITVSLISLDGRRSPGWSLKLAHPPAWQMEIDKLSEKGEFEKFSVRLAQLRRTAPPNEQGMVLRALAGTARDKENDEEHERLARQGIDADRAEGQVRGEAEKTGWLARLYLRKGRFDDARRILSDLRLPAGAPAEARYWKSFYTGILSQRVGNYREALENIGRGVQQAERVGLSYRFEAEQVLANVHQALGQSQKASDIFTRLRAQADNKEKGCDFADLLTNQGWSQLLAREGGQDLGDPTPTLEEAKVIYDNRGCLTEQRLNARLNLALAHLQGNRPRQARRELDEAGPLDSEANLEQRLWRYDLDG
ncbi:MAG TPA: hypothetical protein VLE27_14875, partial [Thermoanaerobaculia bacterium]|nr:hypothetical protein [Thermoanaerobaculia bacterium]